MFDIEKKVALEEGDLQTIERLATFLGSHILTDTYFDTPDYRYTTNDMWLRERECQFELKVGQKSLDGSVDSYEEVTNEEKILEKLGLEKEKNLSTALPRAKIFPYATFQTARRRYKLDKFTIELDLAYFDDFIYRTAEIGISVSSEEQVAKAKEDLMRFIDRVGLHPERPVKAKLVEFLSQKNPSHYQALVSAGVVK